jgi:hypothetical protein
MALENGSTRPHWRRSVQAFGHSGPTGCQGGYVHSHAARSQATAFAEAQATAAENTATSKFDGA